MKILHCCLSNYYIDGWGFQENQLVREHVAQGHDVQILSSTEIIGRDEKPKYLPHGSYMTQEGARIIRLPYRGGVPTRLAAKLRMHPGVYGYVAAFAPDTILFHGTCGWEFQTVARYAREHPHVLLYADSHEDFNNSARGFLSREILHKIYYRYIVSRSIDAVRKCLCISLETIDFVQSVYNIPAEKIEFYPLGGNPVKDDQYTLRREGTRAKYGIEDGQILIVQVGKQQKRKKLIESLHALQQVLDPRVRFIIAGAILEDIKPQVDALIAQEPRANFVGWLNFEEMSDLLCAADIYLQPGTQSVSMQHSLCCRCAVILDDTPAHKPYLQGNGWLCRDTPTLASALEAALSSDLEAAKAISFKVANEMLDYTVLARRVLS